MRNEPDAWRAVGAHIRLPVVLLDLFAEVDQAREQRDGLRMPGPVPAVTDGTDPGEAVDAQQLAQADTDRATQVRRAAAQRLTVAQTRAAVWIAQNRDALITGTLRPALVQTLAEATDAVRVLVPFAPALDPAAILRDGTPEQREAGHRLLAMQAAVDAMHAAWLSSWKRATMRAGDVPGAQRAPGHLYPDAPGGVHAWQRPAEVPADVRDGRDRRVIAIAHHAGAGGYRLASLAEITAMDHETELAYPPKGHERMIRRVLLPGRPRTRGEQAAMKKAGAW